MTVHHDYSYRLGLSFMQKCHTTMSEEFLKERFATLRQSELWLDHWEVYEFNLWVKGKTEEDFTRLLGWLQDLHDTQAAMLNPHQYPLPARHYASRAHRNANLIPENLHEPLIRVVKLLGSFYKEERVPSTI